MDCGAYDLMVIGVVDVVVWGVVWGRGMGRGINRGGMWCIGCTG